MEKNIMKKAQERYHGYFLWVSTMIDWHCAPAEHRETLLKRLENIPNNLMDFYEKLVEWPVGRKKDWKWKIRQDILLLLLDARRALTLDEVDTASQFNFENRQPLNKRQENIREIIKQFCWPLVSIINGRVVFVHTLVKDFLMRTRRSIHITQVESDVILAHRYLNVLSESENRDPTHISRWLYKTVYGDCISDTTTLELQKDKAQEVAFYEYAAEFWHHHLTSIDNPPMDLLSKAQSFLHNFEFVLYSEYLYGLKSGQMGPISEVQAKLKSWRKLLPPDLRELLNIDDFFENPYSTLTLEYAKNDYRNKEVQYICLYRLSNFYTVQAKSEKRYETFRIVADDLQTLLGKNHPISLRAEFMFAACLLPRHEFAEALELVTEVSEIQKLIRSLNKANCWKSLELIAQLQFLMTDFEKTAITQRNVMQG